LVNIAPEKRKEAYKDLKIAIDAGFEQPMTWVKENGR